MRGFFGTYESKKRNANEWMHVTVHGNQIPFLKLRLNLFLLYFILLYINGVCASHDLVSLAFIKVCINLAGAREMSSVSLFLVMKVRFNFGGVRCRMNANICWLECFLRMLYEIPSEFQTIGQFWLKRRRRNPDVWNRKGDQRIKSLY